MKKILTLAALTAAILTTNIPAFATADLPDLRISDSGQQIVEGQSATPEQTAEAFVIDIYFNGNCSAVIHLLKSPPILLFWLYISRVSV